jgi:hypothetical protein
MEEMDKAQKGSAFAWVKENVSLWTAVSPLTVRVQNASHAQTSLFHLVRISADLLVAIGGRNQTTNLKCNGLEKERSYGATDIVTRLIADASILLFLAWALVHQVQPGPALTVTELGAMV